MEILEDFIQDTEAPVLAIGAASIDIVGRLQGDLQQATSNPAHIRTSFGGTARNVAENLARFGQPVILLTSIGQETVGKQLFKHTTESGVNTRHVIRSDEFPTGSYLAVVNQSGEMVFALDDMRAVAGLTPEYLRENEKLFQRASLLFLDANLEPETLETAVSLAKEASLPVCADPTSTGLAPRLLPHLPDLFLVTPNSMEAAILCGESEPITDRERGMEAARYLVSQGVDFAIVTLAEFGVSYATSETAGHVPAIRTRIVDPTGASDALTATLMFALLNGIQTDEAVRLGVSAASLTLRHRGAVRPDLTLETLYDQLV